ncbi:hypothetical protein CFC21_029475, partial [Triticum aestivum]
AAAELSPCSATATAGLRALPRAPPHR